MAAAYSHSQHNTLFDLHITQPDDIESNGQNKLFDDSERGSFHGIEMISSTPMTPVGYKSPFMKVLEQVRHESDDESVYHSSDEDKVCVCMCVCVYVCVCVCVLCVWNMCVHGGVRLLCLKVHLYSGMLMLMCVV